LPNEKRACEHTQNLYSLYLYFRICSTSIAFVSFGRIGTLALSLSFVTILVTVPEKKKIKIFGLGQKGTATLL
jgi:hypothetical protein